MKNKLIAILLLLCSVSLFAESKLLPGTSKITDFIASSQLSSGAGVVEGESLLDAMVNPATQYFRKRLTLDVQYGGVFGESIGADARYLGHEASLLIGVPMPVGFFTFGGGYLDSITNHFRTETQGFGTFSYGAPVENDYALGGGLKFFVGEGTFDENIEFSVLGDFGFTKNVGETDQVDELVWGMSLQNIGWGTIANLEDSGSYNDTESVSLFTLAAGVSFEAFENDDEDFSIDCEFDLELPTFQNLRLGMGAGFKWTETFEMKIATTIDVRELAGLSTNNSTGTNFGSLIPSIGFIYRYDGKDDKPLTEQTGITLRTGLAAVTLDDVYGLGMYNVGATIPIGMKDKVTPIADIAIDSNIVGNKFSFQKIDKYDFDLTSTMVEEIEDWKVEITDSKQNIVKEFSGETELLNKVQWDGKISQDIIADGNYKAKLTVNYNGKDVAIDTERIYVDSISPVITVKEDINVNEKGIPVFTIEAEDKSKLQEWTVKIVDTQNRVIKTVPVAADKYKLDWDGLDTTGKELEAGKKYKLVIDSSDIYGNSSKKIYDFKSIVIVPPYEPVIDLDLSSNKVGTEFSFKDIDKTYNLGLSASHKEYIRTWSLKLLDENNKVIREFTESGIPPKTVYWDGKDSSGKMYNGSIKCDYSVLYNEGHNPNDIENIFVDSDAPVIEVNKPKTLFSPDGDGKGDRLDYQLTFDDISEVTSWDMKIYDKKNRLFKTFEGSGSQSTIDWDGVSDNGDTVSTAESYSYIINSVDALGNKSEFKGSIDVDVLIVDHGDYKKILVATIIFAPNSPEFDYSRPETVKSNYEILNKISVALKKYKGYQIIIEGHANRLDWYDEELAMKEEKNDLLPLSQSRSEKIMSILVKNGISQEVLSATGKGGMVPVVDPKKDLENWKVNQYKNRRVEFIIKK